MLVSPPAASRRTLISHGFAPTGKDYLTSGITGEPIETYIFCPLVSHSLQVRDGESLLQKVFSKPESSESHP
jgi:hypothetical protein